jgi:hypothetical protein
MCEYCGCQAVTAIDDLTREHDLKEQDGVFPAALANLNPEHWDVIDTIRATVGTLLPAPGR